MNEIQDEYREYKKLCRVEDDPGVAGLAQLGRNAIERVRQLERERDELRAGLERLAQLYEDEHDLCDRPMWLRELIARPALEAERAERELQEPELAKALSVIVDYLGSTAECGYDPFAAEPLIESARAALAKAGVK